MSTRTFLVTSLLLAAATAGAADLKGKLSPPPSGAGSHAVVWVEGAVATPPPAPLVITQKDVSFQPAFSVAVVGQTVKLPNADTVVHNAFSMSPAKPFNLGLYAQGDSRTVVVDKPGVVDIFCAIHRQMSARVLVVPNGMYAPVAADGTWTVRGVAPGTATVVAWRDGQEQRRQLTVTAAGAPATEFTFTGR